MAYTQYTLDQIVAEIASDLSDPQMVYWVYAEIQAAFNESLRSWSGDTTYWRARGTFTANPSPLWYDLSTLLPSLRPRTVTYAQLAKEIQYLIAEPPIGIDPTLVINGATGLTFQFSIEAILQALVRARNRFVLDAQLPYSLTPSLPINNDGVLTLPESTAVLHRLSIQDTQNIRTVLHRSDEFAFDAHNSLWPISPSKPQKFSQAAGNPLFVQLEPIPSALYSADAITISTNNIKWQEITTATLLSIPDDFAPAVKWSAIATLLDTDAENSDPFRSNYASFRYRTLLSSAKMHRSALRAVIGGVGVECEPVQAADTAIPNWENLFGPQPRSIPSLYDLIAFAPRPQALIGVALDVAQAAPVLLTPSSTLQLGLEDLETLYQLTKHILSFKLGGSEFRQTFQMHDDYQTEAGQRNNMLNVQARYLSGLFNRQQAELSRRPNMSDIGDSLPPTHPSQMVEQK